MAAVLSREDRKRRAVQLQRGSTQLLSHSYRLRMQSTRLLALSDELCRRYASGSVTVREPEP